MKNKLALLGFLGFLGLLGFLTDNPGFYGFFGFFGFFGYSRVLPDELFQKNFNRAAKNGFLAGVILFPIILIWGTFTSFTLAYVLGFSVNFGLQMLVFSISFTLYEKNGD